MWKILDPYTYQGFYRISDTAEVQRKLGNEWHTVKPEVDDKGILRIHLVGRGCKLSNTRVVTLMNKYFLPQDDGNTTIIFLDGDQTNCRLDNLKKVSNYRKVHPIVRRELKRVKKVDREGNTVERYCSMVEAGEKNFLSASSVSLRCRHKISDPYKALGGYTFEYDEGEE